MTKCRALFWIVCLAFLSVGARNFEEGISLDGPIYATISRNIARTGEWFRMDCQIPDFIPFAEHPHLGYWLMAGWLKIFPAADWAVRIPGHLFYVIFLFSLFLYVRPRGGEKVAIWTIVLLWTCHLFSNIFSTFYLDPGVLCLGTFSLWAFEKGVRRRPIACGLLSGVLLGLAVAYKGLTVLGFGPVFAWLLLEGAWERRWRSSILTLASFIGGTAAVVGAYYLMVKQSSVPDFFDIYFGRQVTRRFAKRWDLMALFSREYWWQLWNYSNYLLPLALLTLPSLRQKRYLVFAWIYALSFIFMFSTSGLVGGQYLIMILPWLAWLIAEGALSKIPLDPQKVVRGTAVLSIAVVLLLQYGPIRTHGRGVTPDWEMVRKVSRAGQVKELYLELPPFKDPFVLSGPFAWYGDVRVSYPEAETEKTPAPLPFQAFLSKAGGAAREAALGVRGWCLEARLEEGTFWLPCVSLKR